MASRALPRVLKKRAAHNHLSIRIEALVCDSLHESRRVFQLPALCEDGLVVQQVREVRKSATLAGIGQAQI